MDGEILQAYLSERSNGKIFSSYAPGSCISYAEASRVYTSVIVDLEWMLGTCATAIDRDDRGD